MWRTCVWLAAAVLLAAPALAAEHGQGSKATADWKPNLVWAGTLMGMDIYNRDGEKLGDVEELVLNHNHSSLSYVVVSYGGTLGLGDKWFAVPWGAFQVRQDGKALILDVDKSRLENAPGFDKNNWPDMGNPEWAKGVERHYAKSGGHRPGDHKDMENRTAGEAAKEAGRDVAEAAKDAGQAVGEAAKDVAQGTKEAAKDVANAGDRAMDRQPRYGQDRFWMRRYSELVGLDIHDYRGEHLADLENIAIDTKEGRTVYAILSFGGLLGIGESLVGVPWSALEMRPQLSAARIDTEKKVLEALAFQQENWPDFTNREYASQLYQKFNQDPYWEVYGYVKTDKTSEKTKDVSEAWKQSSKYNQAFDPKTVISINGTIESVGTFRPAEGAAEGWRLRVKKDSGETVTVHAGPKSYVSSQGITYHYGDKISVTGSKIDWQGKSVLIASKITHGEKTVELRTEGGEPKWKEADIR